MKAQTQEPKMNIFERMHNSGLENKIVAGIAAISVPAGVMISNKLTSGSPLDFSHPNYDTLGYLANTGLDIFAVGAGIVALSATALLSGMVVKDLYGMATGKTTGCEYTDAIRNRNKIQEK